MEELNALIKGSEVITDKMWLTLEKAKDKEITKENAMKELDLLARELTCIAGTIKQVAYEMKTPERLDKWRTGYHEKENMSMMGARFNP